MKGLNEMGNIKSKKVAEAVAEGLGLSVVESMYGGYIVE